MLLTAPIQLQNRIFPGRTPPNNQPFYWCELIKDYHTSSLHYYQVLSFPPWFQLINAIRDFFNWFSGCGSFESPLVLEENWRVVNRRLGGNKTFLLVKCLKQIFVLVKASNRTTKYCLFLPVKSLEKSKQILADVPRSNEFIERCWRLKMKESEVLR